MKGTKLAQTRTRYVDGQPRLSAPEGTIWLDVFRTAAELDGETAWGRLPERIQAYEDVDYSDHVVVCTVAVVPSGTGIVLGEPTLSDGTLEYQVTTHEKFDTEQPGETVFQYKFQVVRTMSAFTDVTGRKETPDDVASTRTGRPDRD